MQIPILGKDSGSGTGTDLNFTIVGGTTQPENPKENTIWVNTDIEITGQSFSAKEPSNPIEGMIWIDWNNGDLSQGVSITNDFDAIVYLYKASQYISGLWYVKYAYIYNNNTWLDLPGLEVHIYDQGKQYYKLVTSGYSRDADTGYNTSLGTVNFNSTGIYIYAYEVSGGQGGIKFFGTESPVYLTDMNTLHIEMDGVHVDSSGYLCISVTPVKCFPGTTQGGVYAKVSTNTLNKTLDISGLKGSYYIVVTARVWSHGDYSYGTIKKIYATR